VASLSFEGDTHGELVQKVRRWLRSVEGEEEDVHLTPAEAVDRGAELTKEALRVVAAAAPQPVAESDLVKSLTGLGYRATEATREAVIAGLDALEEVTGGSVVHRGEDAARSALWQMNSAVAKQVLKALTAQR
jgi:hypothetical protein